MLTVDRVSEIAALAGLKNSWGYDRIMPTPGLAARRHQSLITRFQPAWSTESTCQFQERKSRIGSFKKESIRLCRNSFTLERNGLRPGLVDFLVRIKSQSAAMSNDWNTTLQGTQRIMLSFLTPIVVHRLRGSIFHLRPSEALLKLVARGLRAFPCHGVVASKGDGGERWNCSEVHYNTCRHLPQLLETGSI